MPAGNRKSRQISNPANEIIGVEVIKLNIFIIVAQTEIGEGTKNSRDILSGEERYMCFATTSKWTRIM